MKKMYELRRLNDEGLEKYRVSLEELKSKYGREARKSLNKNQKKSRAAAYQKRLDQIPFKLIRNNTTSEKIRYKIELDENKVFDCQYDCGNYLVKQFGPHNISEHYLADRGFWSAISLLYLKQCMPKTTAPDTPVNLLSEEQSKETRHTIRSAWMLVSAQGKNSDFLLNNKMNIGGQVQETLFQNSGYIHCDSVIEVARMVYMSKKAMTKKGVQGLKKGSARTGFGVPPEDGNFEDFNRWLKRIDMNYELHSIQSKNLYNMMDPLFDTFKNKP